MNAPPAVQAHTTRRRAYRSGQGVLGLLGVGHAGVLLRAHDSWRRRHVRKAAVAALAAGADIAPQTEDEVKWFGIEESSEEGEGERP